MSIHTIGLGCMRLSTAPDRDDAASIRVILAALDAGVTLLDTADAYCRDDAEVGHNERLIAQALRMWSGDRSKVTVATKGGLVRPGGAWVPDGRAKHLRTACDASRVALGVESIDLYQLHVVDPKTPLETSVRALASLREAGKIRRVGLSNVNVTQIVAARRIVDVASVQVSLSVLDDENLKNGVVRYCLANAIQVIAYRPLGGRQGSARIARDSLLLDIAERLGATPHEVALAWLMRLGVVPIPGATREESARSLARALVLELRDEDCEQLNERFSGHLLRRASGPSGHRADPGADEASGTALGRAAPRAHVDSDRTASLRNARAESDVVLVMGMPGSGKSSVAHELEAEGYERLNRDSRGGSLADLIPELDAGLAKGRSRWVLDNTYASRASRNEVIECAARHGVGVRSIWVDTSVGDAQINAITRLLEAHGRLPPPEELRATGKKDPRFFGPDAQFRYQRTVEPPSMDEGFTSVERRAFVRRVASEASARAIVLELDDVLEGDVRISLERVAALARYAAAGWKLFAHCWRPQVASGETSLDEVEQCFERVRELVGMPIELACCPHPAGPPICWCRKPIPGLVLAFVRAHAVDLQASIVVGGAAADRTLADRIHAICQSPDNFFEVEGPSAT